MDTLEKEWRDQEESCPSATLDLLKQTKDFLGASNFKRGTWLLPCRLFIFSLEARKKEFQKMRYRGPAHEVDEVKKEEGDCMLMRY